MVWAQNLYEKIKNLKTIKHKKFDLSRFLKPKKKQKNQNLKKTIFSTPGNSLRTFIFVQRQFRIPVVT